MLKILLRSIPIVLLFNVNVMQAQQPEDCSSCACTVPAMLGTSIWATAAAHPPCDPSAPTSYTVDPGRHVRFYGLTGNRYTFTLCTNTANTMVYVTNNAAMVIKCDDDGCGSPDGPSEVSFIPYLTGLHRLYIMDGSCGSTYAENTMTMELMVTCAPVLPPPNDNPCGAIQLPMSTNTCNFLADNNLGATNSSQAAPIGIGVATVLNCTGSNYQGYDLWYSVEVPASGLIGIQTQEDSLCAGAFSLYTATNCALGSSFTQLPGSCTIVGLDGPTSEPAVIYDAFAAGLPPGQLIYIRYWERGGNENGSFQICAFDGIDFVGIEDQEERGPFQVFPNPNNGSFTITNTGDAARLGIRLIDIGGRSIHSTEAFLATNSPFSIDLGRDVSPGLYQLQLIGGTSTRSLRLMLE